MVFSFPSVYSLQMFVIHDGSRWKEEKGKINYVLQNYFQPVVGDLQQNAHIYVDFLVRIKKR